MSRAASSVVATSALSDLDSFANQPVVVDNGSGLLKAGFAGADMPKLIFPAYVGRPKHVKVMATGAGESDYFVGDKARELRGLLRLRYPQSHGVVQDWEEMHAVWSHMYQELQIAQDQHPVLLTEPPLNPKANRGKAAEIFFETFNVPALYVQVQAILSLYASGRTTGVVLDSGDGVTSAVPVYEGFTLPTSITRMDLGGRDVTDYLSLLLRKNAGLTMTTSAEREIVKEMKEKICYVAINIEQYEKELAGGASGVGSRSSGVGSGGVTGSAGADKGGVSATSASSAADLLSGVSDDFEPELPYKLPDGSTIMVGSEKFRAPEILFNPALIGKEDAGMAHCVVDCISKCDLDLRRTLFGHITLAGGSTLFDGFGDRLLSEVKRLAPRDTKIKIWAPPDRMVSTWIGGSILASLATFKKMWITKKEYEEGGRNAIYRKIF